MGHDTRTGKIDYLKKTGEMEDDEMHEQRQQFPQARLPPPHGLGQQGDSTRPFSEFGRGARGAPCISIGTSTSTRAAARRDRQVATTLLLASSSWPPLPPPLHLSFVPECADVPSTPHASSRLPVVLFVDRLLRSLHHAIFLNPLIHWNSIASASHSFTPTRGRQDDHEPVSPRASHRDHRSRSADAMALELERRRRRLGRLPQEFEDAGHRYRRRLGDAAGSPTGSSSSSSPASTPPLLASRSSSACYPTALLRCAAFASRQNLA